MTRQGELRENSAENVRKFWSGEAQELGHTAIATIRDVCFRNMELHFYSSILPPRRKMLDVGCGNGHGTVYLHRTNSYSLGIDYTEELINIAKAYSTVSFLQEELRKVMFQLPFPDFNQINKELRFETADILALRLGENFDLIVGQRILINLVSHENQMVALENVRNACSPGAKLFLTEATEEGHCRADAIRKTAGLSKLEKYWHNCYVKESMLGEWKSVGWQVKEILSFDTYFLFSKVIYPAAVGESNCEFLSPANKSAMLLSNRFRTFYAAKEVGLEKLIALYLNILSGIDTERKEYDSIKYWIGKYWGEIDNWSNFGHQKVIVAEAI